MAPAPPSDADAGRRLGVTPRLLALRAAPRRTGEASFFFYDAHFGNDAVKVMPGEHFVHDEDILILTTLGSCIAVCLWDRHQHVGGMNHFMLPAAAPGSDDSGRFGTHAMELLINEMVKRGATRATMEAKVFGGASVLGGLDGSQIGERNTRFVLDYLHTERIAVVAKDVLDRQPRKVCFFPVTGRALVKRLASQPSSALLAQEQAAARRAPPAAAAGGSVELF